MPIARRPGTRARIAPPIVREEFFVRGTESGRFAPPCSIDRHRRRKFRLRRALGSDDGSGQARSKRQRLDCTQAHAMSGRVSVYTGWPKDYRPLTYVLLRLTAFIPLRRETKRTLYIIRVMRD